MCRRAALVALGLVFLGCPSRPGDLAPAALDAGAAEADAGYDAGGPAPFVPVVTVTWEDGGVATVGARDAIEPPRSVAVRLPRRLKDGRLRLMDHEDKVVASDDSLSADGLGYEIAPAEPLRRGRTYTLLLDAEVGAAVADEAGVALDDWEFAFVIAGDPEPAPAPAKPAAASKAKPKKKRR